VKYEDITETIIGCAFAIHNELGFGFLEKVYKNALIIELNNSGLKTESEFSIKVKYKNNIVGDYIADIIVNNCVIIEVKAIKELAQIHEVQLVNYLKATGIEIGLLINFGKSVDIKRKMMNTDSIKSV